MAIKSYYKSENGSHTFTHTVVSFLSRIEKEEDASIVRQLKMCNIQKSFIIKNKPFNFKNFNISKFQFDQEHFACGSLSLF